MATAAAPGISPVAPSATSLRDLADGRTVKWAIRLTGDLRLIPTYTPSGAVIAHRVLVNGGPALAAGEAVRDVADDGRVGLVQYDAHSGHSFPLYNPVEQERVRTQVRALGRDLFARCNVVIPADAWSA